MYCVERHFKKLCTVIITGKLANSSWHLYRQCFVVSLDIGDFTFIAHAQKRQPERFKRPEKCKRNNVLYYARNTPGGYQTKPYDLRGPVLAYHRVSRAETLRRRDLDASARCYYWLYCISTIAYIISPHCANMRCTVRTVYFGLNTAISYFERIIYNYTLTDK